MCCLLGYLKVTTNSHACLCRFADGSKLESSTVSQTGFSDKASVTPSAAVANPVDLGQYRLYSTPQAMYLCMQDPRASSSDDSNLLGYSVLATFSPVDQS